MRPHLRRRSALGWRCAQRPHSLSRETVLVVGVMQTSAPNSQRSPAGTDVPRDRAANVGCERLIVARGVATPKDDSRIRRHPAPPKRRSTHSRPRQAQTFDSRSTWHLRRDSRGSGSVSQSPRGLQHASRRHDRRDSRTKWPHWSCPQQQRIRHATFRRRRSTNPYTTTGVTLALGVAVLE